MSVKNITIIQKFHRQPTNTSYRDPCSMTGTKASSYIIIKYVKMLNVEYVYNISMGLLQNLDTYNCDVYSSNSYSLSFQQFIQYTTYNSTKFMFKNPMTHC